MSTERKIRILIDPGHDYAKANQSPVVKNYYEGERMWQLSQYQKAALEARGFEVGLTKSKVDQKVSVTQRGRMAKGYDVLISDHTNAENTGKVDRPTGIHLADDNCGKIDEISKELAVLLSQAVAEVMGTSNPAKQTYKLSGNDRDGDGKKNDDYYGVLFGAHQVGVPALIMEHSFHTNKRAATWLMDDDNLKLLAEREADALAQYYGLDVTEPVTPAIKRDDAKSKDEAYRGTYTVGAPHLRVGASMDKQIIKELPAGSTVKCYGYFTDEYLLVQLPDGTEGFIHRDCLTKN